MAQPDYRLADRIFAMFDADSKIDNPQIEAETILDYKTAHPKKFSATAKHIVGKPVYLIVAKLKQLAGVDN